MPLLSIIAVYIAPGLALSKFFTGRLGKSPLFWLFLSFLINPFFYVLLTYTGVLSLWSFLALSLALVLTTFFIKKGFWKKIDLDEFLPNGNLAKPLTAALLVFWLMTVLPRVGLIRGNYPIGDDMHRLGKTISVAESPGLPLFYHFPTTRLTIYYYVTVGSGLLVRFSNNQITANVAWFIHTSLWTLSMLFFLGVVAENVFRKLASKLVFTGALTFFAGYEFYIALFKGINTLSAQHWTDLEWWTDWFDGVFNIHFQISSPYTLFFWVPQHLFAGVLSLLLFLLMSSKTSKTTSGRIFTALVLSSILGYSAFVFLTVAVSFAAVQILNLSKKDASWKEFVLDNAAVAIFFLIFSADTILLYLTAEKSSWFTLRLNSFWFLENTTLINKVINLLMTVPTLLTIELGGLSFIFLYIFSRFGKERERTWYFWYLNIIIPFVVMFFVRAADDNNISLRSTIPSLIGLALFSGKFMEKTSRTNIKTWLLLALLLLSLPTTFAMFYQRFSEQEDYGRQKLKTIYQLIDQKTPLNSIIVTNEDQWTNISVLSHRFTFKPLKEFNVTDKEYSAFSKIRRYKDFKSSTLEEITEFIAEIRKENGYLNNYKFYLLTSTDQPLPLVLGSGSDKLYSL